MISPIDASKISRILQCASSAGLGISCWLFGENRTRRLEERAEMSAISPLAKIHDEAVSNQLVFGLPPSFFWLGYLPSSRHRWWWSLLMTIHIPRLLFLVWIRFVTIKGEELPFQCMLSSTKSDEAEEEGQSLHQLCHLLEEWHIFHLSSQDCSDSA